MVGKVHYVWLRWKQGNLFCPLPAKCIIVCENVHSHYNVFFKILPFSIVLSEFRGTLLIFACYHYILPYKKAYPPILTFCIHSSRRIWTHLYEIAVRIYKPSQQTVCTEICSRMQSSMQDFLSSRDLQRDMRNPLVQIFPSLPKGTHGWIQMPFSCRRSFPSYDPHGSWLEWGRIQ